MVSKMVNIRKRSDTFAYQHDIIRYMFLCRHQTIFKTLLNTYEHVPLNENIGV